MSRTIREFVWYAMGFVFSIIALHLANISDDTSFIFLMLISLSGWVIAIPFMGILEGVLRARHDKRPR